MPTIQDFENLCPGLQPQHIAVYTDEDYESLPEADRKNCMKLSYFLQHFDTLSEENIAFFITDNAEKYMEDHNLTP